MAAVNFSSVEDAMATVFDDMLYTQINGTCPEVKLFAKELISAKNVSWSVEYGSATGQNFTDGSDVSVYNADTLNDAKLDFANLGDAIQVSNKARTLTRATGNPKALSDLRMQQLASMSRRVAKHIASEIWSGPGTSERMHGLTASNGPLSDSGTYATIARGSVSQWQGNVLENGGIARPVTAALLRQMLTSIFDACGQEPDVILCDATVFQNYAEIFDDKRRYVKEISVRGERYALDAGEKVLEFDGIPIMRTANCPVDSSGNGQMAFLNLGDDGARICLPSTMDLDADDFEVEAVGTPQVDAGDGRTGLRFRVQRLARSGDYVRHQGVLYPCFAVKSPFTCGWLKDIAR